MHYLNRRRHCAYWCTYSGPRGLWHEQRTRPDSGALINFPRCFCVPPFLHIHTYTHTPTSFSPRDSALRAALHCVFFFVVHGAAFFPHFFLVFVPHTLEDLFHWRREWKFTRDVSFEAKCLLRRGDYRKRVLQRVAFRSLFLSSYRINYMLLKLVFTFEYLTIFSILIYFKYI